MNYKEFKNKKEESINNLMSNIAFFAFSDDQLKEGLKKLNIKEDEIKEKLVSIGHGGYALKKDAHKIKEHTIESNEDIKKLMEDEKFAISAFDYELGNHEFTYTGDSEDAVEALGYTAQEVSKNPHLLKCCNEAIELQWAWDEANN